MDILSSSTDNKIAWFENIGGIEGFGSFQIISTTANGASSVYSADLDNDGDMDVLSSSSYDHKIAWYENTDGQGTFGPQQIITANAESAKSVFAADLDQDGDMDVLSLSVTIYGDKIAWYENNGQGNFGPQLNITNYADTSNFSVTDIDNDGDMDIITSSYADGEIILFENIDGQGSFSYQQIIISSVNQISKTYAVDIDGDNDIDILELGNTLAWYENIDGQGSFNQEALEISDNTYQHVIVKDIDNDDDLDILVSKNGNSNSYDDDRILWYENLGQGSFGSENIISTTSLNTRSLGVSDIDEDGDLDVISVSGTQDSKIAWYENTDGQGAFGPQKIITKSSVDTKSLYTTDIDGDGDIDVLSASSFVHHSDGKIAWYENINGQGNFVQKIITANDVVNASGVYAADINGDSKIDVVSSSESKLAWYENIDGQGNFGLQQIIATDNLVYTPKILTVDLDIDGI